MLRAVLELLSLVTVPLSIFLSSALLFPQLCDVLSGAVHEDHRGARLISRLYQVPIVLNEHPIAGFRLLPSFDCHLVPIRDYHTNCGKQTEVCQLLLVP